MVEVCSALHGMAVSPPSRLRTITERVEGTGTRGRGDVQQRDIFWTWHSHALMNSQQLWSSTQDEYKSKLVNMLARMEERLMRLDPTEDLLATGGEGATFLQAGGCCALPVPDGRCHTQAHAGSTS